MSAKPEISDSLSAGIKPISRAVAGDGIGDNGRMPPGTTVAAARLFSDFS